MATYKQAIIKSERHELEGAKEPRVYKVKVSDPDSTGYESLYERGMVVIYKEMNAASRGKLETYSSFFIQAEKLEFIEGSEFEE